MREGSNPEEIDVGCKWCDTHPYSPCVGCAHRRRKVMRLQAQGLAVQEIAKSMRISVQRVQRLIEEDADIREVESLKCNTIPVKVIQELFEERKRRDGLTISRLCELVEHPSRIDLERVMGYAPTSAATKNGRYYPGKCRTQIDVGMAGRIVRALGLAPHEVKDL